MDDSVVVNALLNSNPPDSNVSASNADQVVVVGSKSTLLAGTVFHPAPRMEPELALCMYGSPGQDGGSQSVGLTLNDLGLRFGSRRRAQVVVRARVVAGACICVAERNAEVHVTRRTNMVVKRCGIL